MIAAGISVSGRTVAEGDVPENEWEDHIADWPEWDPEACGRLTRRTSPLGCAREEGWRDCRSYSHLRPGSRST